MKRFLSVAKWVPAILCGLLIVAMEGCAAPKQVFSGRTTFCNKTDRPLWVESVQGFEREPPVGYLVKRKLSSASMHPMSLPKTVLITWRDYRTDEENVDVLTEVPLTGLKTSGKRDSILFEFKDDVWTATIVPE